VNVKKFVEGDAAALELTDAGGLRWKLLALIIRFALKSGSGDPIVDNRNLDALSQDVQLSFIDKAGCQAATSVCCNPNHRLMTQHGLSR
jgi:hypothetical protein